MALFPLKSPQGLRDGMSATAENSGLSSAGKDDYIETRSTRVQPFSELSRFESYQNAAPPGGISIAPEGELGVNVEKAEKEFADLGKELARASHRNLRSASQNPVRNNDEEKAISNEGPSEDVWDLEATLRGTRAREKEAGIKAKRIGVIWDRLTVKGIGGARNAVRTFPDAFISFVDVIGALKRLIYSTPQGKETEILRGFRGVAKPGEMVLVLGRPGSGCTTFLKVISNQRSGYTSVDGEIHYGPFDAKTFESKYRGEAVYNQEDDIHHPSLTVGQTLDFALDTKTPGKRAGLSQKEFKDKVASTLLKMFNIEHTVDTVVGNAFMRGISGGERKRVSIAEMMVTGAAVCAWDNTTRGLDASTALDYAKSLRIITNIYQTTTFVSLYQASETIYKQFDKVLVIDSGRQVFFGPAQDARGYFEGLGFVPKPRMTTADYLTGCTDEYEREYEEGQSADSAPATPDSFADAFSASKFSRDLQQDMPAYREQIDNESHVYEEFQLANKEAKRRHIQGYSVYSIPYYLQVWSLMKRQTLLKLQDRFMLCVSWITSLILAIVLATVWLQLPKTSAGAFPRGGLLFIALLFNAFQAFGELAATMLGRPIINKHRAFTFHRPSALFIGQLIVDLAFASLQILVFSIIVYFSCDLALDAGAFFTFYLCIVTTYACFTLFFRTIGCLCPDFDYAIKFVAVIITLFVITSGYIIQPQSQQVWLRWFFYLNAVGLGFSSMMMNEFKRLHLLCTQDSIIPSGSDYDSLAYSICTLPGSVKGSRQIEGSQYIKTAFSYDPIDLWRNWAIIVVLIAGFLFTNVTLGEILMFAKGSVSISYAKENEETRQLNSELKRKQQQRRRHETDNAASDLDIASKSVLTWENLSYDVPVPGGKLRLLREVYGYVRPGELTALMGASGAGKTTLLDVLAARKNVGVIGGDILVDGIPPGTSFQRGTSYAEQLDVLESTQTVREAFRFSADLRQPYEVAREQKYNYVEEILSLLEMEDIADAIIGDADTGSGLSVEQRKRCTIGIELAAKPELLFFLDEPTSGLDSQSAFNIVRFLRKLAARGQAILCTIHQPNSALFENFDRLLLLQKGGECVYFGDIGKDAEVLLDYFRRNGADCPSDANPAEWMLDAIGAGLSPRIGSTDWGDIWRDSSEHVQVKDAIIRMKHDRISQVQGTQQLTQKEYASPLWHQIKVVVRRTNLSFWRSPNYGFTRLYNHVAVALFSGLAFLQLDDSRSSLQYRVFVVFQVTVMPALILAQVEPKYDLARLIFYRENAAKAYSQFPFALAMVLAETPYSILCAVAFFLPLYYLPGFKSTSSAAGYQFLQMLLAEFFSVTLGQAIAAATPSSFISSILNPPILITFALFCGVTIPKPQIPGFWRAWLVWLDPMTYLVGGMVATELHARPVHCTPSEYNVFEAPPGRTCGQYMQAFFAAGGAGYLAENDTSVCRYCAYKTGDQFYEPLGIRYEERWRDLGVMAAFCVSNVVLLFAASRWLNFNRR